MLKLPLLVCLGLASPAMAGQYFSAQSCQALDAPNGLTHDPQGSVSARADVSITCPVQTRYIDGMQHVRVYYAVPTTPGAAALSCRLWKLDPLNHPEAGQTVTSLDQRAGVLDLYSSRGPARAIGMNIECQLRPGAKVLSYYVY